MKKIVFFTEEEDNDEVIELIKSLYPGCRIRVACQEDTAGKKFKQYFINVFGRLWEKNRRQ